MQETLVGERRLLGRTGLGVSPLGFGAFKIGRNEKIKYAEGYSLPTEAETERLLNGVLDLGVNLIDTAPAYGISEERVGKLIGHRRREFVLSSKVGETFENGQSTYDFSRGGMTASVERSLRRLRTEALDLLLIHSDGRDMQILTQSDAVETMLALKQRGLARFIGMSGKTIEGHRRSFEWTDVVMVEYHPEDRSHEQVIEEAGRRGVGVLVKKPLASGKLKAEEAIPFILRRPEVASLVIGGLRLENVKRNLETATGAMR